MHDVLNELLHESHIFANANHRNEVVQTQSLVGEIDGELEVDVVLVLIYAGDLEELATGQQRWSTRFRLSQGT